LDQVAAARWEWAHTSQPAERALRGVQVAGTNPDLSIDTRLSILSSWLTHELQVVPTLAVIIEKPSRGGMYDRSRHVMVAVQESLYWSTLASGALVLTCRLAGVRVELLEVGTLKKEKKHAIARRVIEAAGLKLPPRRKVWREDELDAVAVGCQAMADRRFFWLSQAYSDVRDASANGSRGPAAAGEGGSLFDPPPSAPIGE